MQCDLSITGDSLDLFLSFFSEDFVDESPGNRGGQVTVDIYGLLLKCNPPTLNTIIFRGYTSSLSQWIPFGRYLAMLFTRYLGRPIVFNESPTEEGTSEKIKEI